VGADRQKVIFAVDELKGEHKQSALSRRLSAKNHGISWCRMEDSMKPQTIIFGIAIVLGVSSYARPESVSRT
jgi:hypothetical protein